MTFGERMALLEEQRWKLSANLFGDIGSDINDFEMHNYVYFLDNVRSQEELVEGLNQLSPLADDALAIAEQMSDIDFHKFKKTLIIERRQEKSVMPRKYYSLLIPKRFINAVPIAEETVVPLGAVLIRLMELEEKSRTV